MTREEIEQLNEIEPYCFVNNREEQWYRVRLQEGLSITDNNPKSPWISVKDDLPCNHKELIKNNGRLKITNKVIYFSSHRGIHTNYMYYFDLENIWLWADKTPTPITHWFAISKPLKEQEIEL